MQNTDVVLCLQKRQNITSPLQQCSSFCLFSTGSLQGGNLVDPGNLDPMLIVGIETEASVMADWHTCRCGSHLLLPTSLSLPCQCTFFSQAGSSPSASSPPAQCRFRWCSESRTTSILPSSRCCCLSSPLLLHQVQPGQGSLDSATATANN